MLLGMVIYMNKDKQKNFEEEYAAEVIPYLPEFKEREITQNELVDYGNLLGYSGIIISIVSLFSAPYVLGLIGIIFGSIAIYEDSKWFGIISIAIANIAILVNVIYNVPFIGLFI
jgi:hypothetical protein